MPCSDDENLENCLTIVCKNHWYITDNKYIIIYNSFITLLHRIEISTQNDSAIILLNDNKNNNKPFGALSGSSLQQQVQPVQQKGVWAEPVQEEENQKLMGTLCTQLLTYTENKCQK